MSSRVSTTIENGVARITMDDGKVNAMSAEMLNDLQQAFETAQQEDATVVLSGREGLFSAGFDMPTFQRGIGPTVEMIGAGVQILKTILGYPRPVVTVCAGHAYPMGAFLMLAADVRFAVDGPWQIGMNEVAIGLTVPNFALALARHRLTPAAFARITTAAMFEPQEAQQHGYLDRVVSAEEMSEVVAEELDRLSKLDMTHFARTKARVNDQVLRRIRDAAESELSALAAH